MSRIAPPLPEGLSTARKALAWEKEVEVQLITRLFGGGARPREIDERSWLRPAALKGALRFWWRATHAHLPEYASLQKLKEREDLLFGSAARFGKKGEILGGPGWLSVEVLNAVPANLQKPLYDPDTEVGKAVGIAYYPGAAQTGKEAARLGLRGTGGSPRIRLRLDVVDEVTEREILLALRAFLLLGGAGARTRRGAGALSPATAASADKTKVPCHRDQVERFLAEWVTESPASVPADVFSLARARWAVVGKACDSPEEAHEKLLGVLREFRQLRTHPPNWDKKTPWGQTAWPEPDAIRLEVGTSSHPTQEEHRAQFPRAVLGLPIVFKFHDKDKEDPGRHTLIGTHRGKRIARFASPLLLRPIRIWTPGKKGEKAKEEYLPVAMYTETTLPVDSYPLLEPTPEAKDRRRTLGASRTFSETSFAVAAQTADLLAKLETAFKNALGVKK